MTGADGFNIAADAAAMLTTTNQIYDPGFRMISKAAIEKAIEGGGRHSRR
jgi:hypothetical protein